MWDEGVRSSGRAVCRDGMRAHSRRGGPRESQRTLGAPWTANRVATSRSKHVATRLLRLSRGLEPAVGSMLKHKRGTPMQPTSVSRQTRDQRAKSPRKQHAVRGDVQVRQQACTDGWEGQYTSWRRGAGDEGLGGSGAGVGAGMVSGRGRRRIKGGDLWRELRIDKLLRPYRPFDSRRKLHQRAKASRKLINVKSCMTHYVAAGGGPTA